MASYLTGHGFDVLEANFRVTGAELDLVCRDLDGLAFVEVRARSLGAIEPSATITSAKLRRLQRGARAWMTQRRLSPRQAPWRFVVAAVLLDDQGQPATIQIIEDPFAYLPEYHHADP
ncbi:MAG: putative endonuclease [Pseudohongiellaceae bacterium]